VEIGIRERMLKELLEKIDIIVTSNPETAKIFKTTYPKNGPAIKLNGIVLYKILRISNPWNKKGIAIHKRILPHVLERINGRLEKNRKWAGCPLEKENYDDIKNILLDLIKKTIASKLKLGTAKMQMQEALPKKKITGGKMEALPKKKYYRRKNGSNNKERRFLERTQGN